MDALFDRTPPTRWEQFLDNPLLFLANCLHPTQSYDATDTQHDTQHPQSQSKPKTKIRVVCISDTHNTHHKLSHPIPTGDIFIHAGDLTNSGKQADLESAFEWMSNLPHPTKIFIAGNHDKTLQEDPVMRQTLLERFAELRYLEDESVEVTVRGRVVRVYGSPWTPKYGSWAFQYPRIRPTNGNRLLEGEKKEDLEEEGRKIWNAIPSHTDILVTHGPPAHHLDHGPGHRGHGIGCVGLLDAVWKIRPRLHIFGHAHAGRGTAVVKWTQRQRRYERIALGMGGWWDLVGLVWARIWEGEDGSEESGTVMVNAASMGGAWDEFQRGPIIVDI